MAYRGRALIELTTTLGELPEVPVEEMPGDDKLRVQVECPYRTVTVFIMVWI